MCADSLLDRVAYGDITPREFWAKYVRCRRPCILVGHPPADQLWKGDEFFSSECDLAHCDVSLHCRSAASRRRPVDQRVSETSRGRSTCGALPTIRDTSRLLFCKRAHDLHLSFPPCCLCGAQRVEHRASVSESYGRGQEKVMPFADFVDLLDARNELHYLTTQGMCMYAP